MDDLSAHLRTVTRITFFFLSLCFVLWALYPSAEGWWGGLVIGAAASLVNAWHLSWKVQRIGGNAAVQGTKRMTLGYLTRACIALLAAVVATRTFSYELAAVVAGLFVAQLATLLLGFLSKRKAKAVKPLRERGENK